MCSDAAKGYEGFKVKNESWAGEATTSESGLHLNVILEMLIRLDQQGNFMNPVDDSIAPDYSKVIKKPMCFLKMRDKIYAGQYTSWASFVEDFECICYNAMKYNQKRSKIWNAANLMLRHGKRCLGQLSSKHHIILGISKVHNGINFQDDIAAKVKVDQTLTQFDALLEIPCEPTSVISTGCLVSNFSVQQGPNSAENISAVNEMVTSEHVTAAHSSEPPSKSLNEDPIIEILSILPEEDIRLYSEDQTTECSSSFSGIQSELEDGSCEVESEFRDGNGANVPTENRAANSRRRKRALDSDWKTYRQGIEWRCRWLELRLEHLQTESNKYKSILETAKTRKDQHQRDGLVARTSTMDGYIHKNRVLRRRRRRRVEENDEYDLYMSKHPVFSRYGKKKQHNQELSSTEEGARDEQQHVLEFDDFNLDFEDEYEDNIVVENESMEHHLWQIEALQMQILKLKHQLSRQATVPVNITREQLKNPLPSQISVSGSPRHTSGPSTQLHSSSGLVPRSTKGGTKGHGGTPSSRRRNSDFDINNVVMPDTEMANYVEPARHAFIETPHWRWQEGMPAQEEESSSEEDTDDEVYKIRHARWQLKEREQQYTPLSLNKGRSISVAKERPRPINDIARRIFTRSVNSDEELFVNPTSFGYIPRKKRRKRETRETRETAAIPKGS